MCVLYNLSTSTLKSAGKCKSLKTLDLTNKEKLLETSRATLRLLRKPYCPTALLGAG